LDFDLSSAEQEKKPAPPAQAAPPAPAPTPTPPAPNMAMASPIADLTYRPYQGKFKPRALRWWIVALSGIRQIMKRPAFWVMLGLCLMPYLLHALSIYLEMQMIAQAGGAVPGGAAGRPGTPGGPGGRRGGPPIMDFSEGEKFSHHFFQALTGDVNSMLLLLIALMVGAGSIAADTRANALMIYLSKPITKSDYLIGKWVSIFLPVYFAAVVPGLLLYLYCLFGYTSDGFLKQEPWLIARIIGAAAVPAVLHASVLVGCSAWSKTPRLAGATYAGIYFITAILAGSVMGQVFFRATEAKRAMIKHSSISGVIDGLAQNIYGTRSISGIMDMIASREGPKLMEKPALWLMATLAAALVLGGIALARAHIRAVEVVRG
jgi:ABC-2 type transport system permease protein